MMHNSKEMKIEVGDVVLIKDEKKNKGKWSIEILEELYKGKDDVMRGVKLRTPTSHIGRPIQYFYPLEPHYDMEKSKSKSKKLNVDEKEYRLRRTAATIAEMPTRDIVADQSEE